jgi:ABC-type multidrug transport system ATPase subunit
LRELSKQICTELRTSDFDSDSTEDIFGESSKLKIGILPEEIILFDLLTPIEHLELYRGLKGSHSFDKPSSRKRLTELLQVLGYDVGDRWMPAKVSQLAGN